MHDAISDTSRLKLPDLLYRSLPPRPLLKAILNLPGEEEDQGALANLASATKFNARRF